MSLHGALAWLAGSLVLVVALLAALGLGRRSIHRVALDRAILAVEVVVLLAVASGAANLIAGRGPDDPLHLVYATAALVLLPIGRFWRGVSLGPRAVPLLVCSIAALGVLVRLAQTG